MKKYIFIYCIILLFIFYGIVISEAQENINENLTISDSSLSSLAEQNANSKFSSLTITFFILSGILTIIVFYLISRLLKLNEQLQMLQHTSVLNEKIGKDLIEKEIERKRLSSEVENLNKTLEEEHYNNDIYRQLTEKELSDLKEKVKSFKKRNQKIASLIKEIEQKTEYNRQLKIDLEKKHLEIKIALDENIKEKQILDNKISTLEIQSDNKNQAIKGLENKLSKQKDINEKQAWNLEKDWASINNQADEIKELNLQLEKAKNKSTNISPEEDMLLYKTELEELDKQNNKLLKALDELYKENMEYENTIEQLEQTLITPQISSTPSPIIDNNLSNSLDLIANVSNSKLSDLLLEKSSELEKLKSQNEDLTSNIIEIQAKYDNIEIKLKEYQKAIVNLREKQINSISDREIWQLWYNSDINYHQGNYKKALEGYKQLIEKDEWKLPVNLLIYAGHSYLQEGKEILALQCYDKAYNLSSKIDIYEEALILSDSLILLKRWGQLQLQHNNYKKAIEIALEGLDKKPNDIQLLDLLIESVWQENIPEKAIKYINKALEIKDDNQLLYELGAIYLKLEATHTEALKVYNKLLIIDPNDIDLYWLIACSYIEQDEIEMALDAFNCVLELEPSRRIEIIDKYQQLLEKNPLNQLLLNQLLYISIANLYLEEKAIDSALENYQLALEYDYSYIDTIMQIFYNYLETFGEDIEKPKIRLALANLYHQKNELEKTLEHYQKVIDEDESYLSEVIEGAEKLIENIEDAKNNLELHNLLAKWYYITGNLAKCSYYYEKTYQLDTDSEQIIIRLIKIYNEILKDSPENAGIHFKLGILYQSQKEWEKALDEFQLARTEIILCDTIKESIRECLEQLSVIHIANKFFQQANFKIDYNTLKELHIFSPNYNILSELKPFIEKGKILVSCFEKDENIEIDDIWKLRLQINQNNGNWNHSLAFIISQNPLNSAVINQIHTFLLAGYVHIIYLNNDALKEAIINETYEQLLENSIHNVIDTKKIKNENLIISQ